MENFAPSIDAIREAVLNFLPRLGLALLTFLIARFVSSVATRILRKAMERRKHDPEMIVLLELLTNWGILSLGIILALEQIAPGRFGALIAGLGIAGFTIGFALQDVAKNFIAGILLLLQQPFDIGDTIQVSGFTGTVLDITLRATEMQTIDGCYALIPNADVFVNPIINYSRATRRRIEITIGVGVDSDLDHVTRVSLDTLQGLPGVMSDPAPQVVFENFGDSAMEFTAYYWIDTSESGVFDARDAGVKAINTAFQEAGIECPYPTFTILSAAA
jgi:small conductance mechanosensitive channel